MENELETVSQSNSELSIRIVEKEQQYKEVRTQVESMRVTYEKHQKELNERLERTVQENSSMMDLQRALDEERRRVDELQICKYNKMGITLRVGIQNAFDSPSAHVLREINFREASRPKTAILYFGGSGF